MQEVNIHILDEIPRKLMKEWNLFSKQELIDILKKCNSLSALSPDKLTWSHIKSIIRDNDCLLKFVDIANLCIRLGHWLSHFKTSNIIVISKLNKLTYNSPKSY